MRPIKSVSNINFESTQMSNISSTHWVQDARIEVDLSRLLSIVDVRDGLYSDDLCAILVEINDAKVRNAYKNCKYLLQVWERTRGKIYEKSLMHRPLGWEICAQFLYMKLDPRDEGDQYWFYEVHLGEVIRESKLRDFKENIDFKYFSCSGNWLYYASSNELYVIQASPAIAQHGLSLKQLEEHGVSHAHLSVPHPLIFHGWLCGKALLEDADNNLFFCDVAFDTTSKPMKIRFNEHLATVPSTDRPADKIVKVLTYSRDVSHLHALVLKQSRTIDFYFNGVKLFSSALSCPTLQIEDIGITSDHIFFRSVEGETMRLKFDGKKRLAFTQAKVCNHLDAGNWSRILHERVRHERIELFFDFKLNDTDIYVTFDRFTSAYDLLNKVFVNTTQQLQGQEAQYLLGVNKDGDTVGLFQEDNSTQKAQQSKVLYINSKQGLVSSQQLPSRIISKAEFWHYQGQAGAETLYNTTYFIVSDGKSRQLLALMPGTDLAPANIGQKVAFTGTPDEHLISIYASKKHESSNACFFGIADSKNREIKIYKHTDLQNFQLVSTLQLHSMTLEAFNSLHTIVDPSSYAPGHHLLITKTAIFVRSPSGSVEQKYASFNLAPYNISIISCKYMYFQNLEGLCLLNLRGAIFQSQAQEILLQRTYNSTNQIQYDPRFQRLLYFSDFETIEIIPLPHKNTVVPWGFNKLTGRFQKDQQNPIEVTFVTKAPEDAAHLHGVSHDQMFKNLVAITKNQSVLTWEYPTGQFIDKADHLLQSVLDKNDRFFPNTSLHTREFGKRYLLFAQPAMEEESKGEAPVRGQLHQFKIIKFKNSANPEIVKQFRLHIIPSDFLHFDIDLHCMLHVQVESEQSRAAVMFVLQDEKDKKCTPRFASMISRFPAELYNHCKQANFLFSPNLVHYLAFDSKMQSFVVHRIDKGTKFRGHNMVVLEGLFNTEDSDFDVTQVSLHFKWESDTMFRVVNSAGFEKLVSINGGNWTIKDSTFVPMKCLLTENANSQYFFEELKNPLHKTFQRLLRRYQRLFTHRQLSLKSKRSTKETSHVLHGDSFFIQHGFTLYHYKLTQSLIKERQDTIAERLDDEDLKTLLLNVFPSNNLFLHKIFQRNKVDPIEENRVHNFHGVTLKKLLSKLYDKGGEQQKFFFPFMVNDCKQTPFDLCIPSNLKSADVMLKYLKFQPAGCHSEHVIQSLSALIASDLPSLPEYLDSRLLQTPIHVKISTMQDFEPIDGKNYMLESSHLSPDFAEFQEMFAYKRTKKLCGRDIPKSQDELLQEKEVKVEVLDLPFVHSYDGEGFSHANKLFGALADTNNIELFTSKAVQYLVDYNWKKTKIYTVSFLFVPFVFFLFTFIAYSNVYNGQFDNPAPAFEVGYLALSALLYFFSLYFLLHEAGQLTLVKGAYFGWGFIWNAIDLFPPIFIIAVVTQRLRQDYEFDELMQPGFIDTVHAIACLLMWLKMLYFLRLFDCTSHLVRVLMHMVWEMKIFIGVLFIVYMGFGEAWLRLAEKGDIAEGDRPLLADFADAFIFSLRLGVGDTDVAGIYDVNQPLTGWILFVLFEVIACIIMLSLLVVLILKQYDRVSKDAELCNYQQKAKLVFENSYLTQLFRCCRCVNTEMRRNLMIITDLTSQGLVLPSHDKDPMQMLQENVKTLMKDNAMLRQMMQKQTRDTEQKLQLLINELRDAKAK